MRHEIYKRHLKCIKVSYGATNDFLEIVKKFRYDLQSLLMPNLFLNGLNHSSRRKGHDEILVQSNFRASLAKNEIAGHLNVLIASVYEREVEWLLDLLKESGKWESSLKRPQLLSYSANSSIMQSAPESWVLSIMSGFIRDWGSTLRRMIVMRERDGIIFERIFDEKSPEWGLLNRKLTNLVRTAILEKVNEARLNTFAVNRGEMKYAQKTHPFSDSDRSVSSSGNRGIFLIPLDHVSGNPEDSFPVLDNFNSLSTIVPLEFIDEDSERGAIGGKTRRLAGFIDEDARGWFSKQSKSFQEKELGVTKYRLMNRDGLTNRQLWNFGRSRTGLGSL